MLNLSFCFRAEDLSELSADNFAWSLVSDTKNDFPSAFVRKSAGVLSQAVEVALCLPLLKLAMLAFESIENLLQPQWDGTHVNKPSRFKIPTNFSSAANAFSELSRSRFIASSTVSISWSTFGST